MFDSSELMPGDTFKINDTFTYMSEDWSGDIQTAEGFKFSDSHDIEVVDQTRPENWPPENHDVWRCGSDTDSYYVLHYLGDEFRDSDGDEIDLKEFLSEDDMLITDLHLLYRLH